MRVYNSHHADVNIPKRDLISFLFDSNYCAAREDTQIHVEAANPANSITKAQCRDLVRRVAHVLRQRYGIGASGAGKDVVVSTSSGNPFIPVIFYSIVAAGGVYSGASSAFTESELVRQLKDADARLLLCSSEFKDNTINAARQCGISLDRILVIDSKIPGDWKLLSAEDGSNILDIRNGPLLNWRRITDQEELEKTTACLLYSSGTTGLPKGVLISHWNLVACNVCGMQIAQNFLDKRKSEGNPFKFSTIAHLPMAHIGGISWSSLNPFYLGGTTYWIEKYEFNSFIEYHRRYRLTVQWSVPPIWLAIAKSPQVTDHFDSLEIAGTGAAPMGSELAKEVARKLGKGKVAVVDQMYGMSLAMSNISPPRGSSKLERLGATETTGTMTGVDWDYTDETASSGAPFANVRLRFIDENDNDVEPGQPGELLISGPFVCQGYHNRPEANKNSFLDGFYRTGDIGIWKDGFVYIVDRLKELIKYKGLQVAPAELEALLISHQKVNDAAVIGIYDETQATELPLAFIVVKPGIAMEAREAIDFVQENASNHKRLRGGVIFVDEIPKSASGKILRKELRQRLANEANLRAKL